MITPSVSAQPHLSLAVFNNILIFATLLVMIAIVDAYRSGLLQSRYWGANILSGLVVGIVALPLAMAFAIASGANPAQGIYTAIIAALLVGVFGGTQVQIAGPTGAFVVILAGITGQYGIVGLQIATLLAGIILITMGFLRLGNLFRIIPETVIAGFTAGIGFIIFFSEWKDFFGLPMHLSLNAHFYQKLFAVAKTLPQLDIATTTLSLLSLSLIPLSGKYFKRLPGPLVALVTATGLQMIFQFKSVATIGSMFGGIPQHLPAFQTLHITHHDISRLIGPAMSIALLGAIESLLSAAAADKMMQSKHHANQELIGQGLANMVSPLFGGFAATGAIARTATNIRNGGNSPLASITHSIFLIIVLLLLAPIATYVPLCSLAAILFVVAYHMSDIPGFIHALKTTGYQDTTLLLSTFFLTIFTDLIVAVAAGVILSMLFKAMTKFRAQPARI
jgi:SulP family sulfate permease